MVYSVAFKKSRSGRLKWVIVDADSERAALVQARTLIAQRYPGKGYRVYAGPLEERETRSR